VKDTAWPNRCVAQNVVAPAGFCLLWHSHFRLSLNQREESAPYGAYFIDFQIFLVLMPRISVLMPEIPAILTDFFLPIQSIAGLNFGTI